jgi:hypothetical protein
MSQAFFGGASGFFACPGPLMPCVHNTSGVMLTRRMHENFVQGRLTATVFCSRVDFRRLLSNAQKATNLLMMRQHGGRASVRLKFNFRNWKQAF